MNRKPLLSKRPSEEEATAAKWVGTRAIGSGLVGARPSARRMWKNRTTTLLLTAAVVFTLVPVVLILIQIAQKGGETIGWEFLTESPPLSMIREGGGFLNGLVGTLIMVGLATLVSVPLGILAAVYLVEYGKRNWLAKLIRFFADVMTGVPSVFVGLFVYTALVVEFKYGAIMGAAALALIMMPIIVRSSEEMLKLVPADLKDASYALGAAKWQTITKVILPASASGLTTGAMLAVARAAGETAPLLMTAGGMMYLVTELWDTPISALTLLIFQQAGQPFDAAVARAWAGALQLLAIVLVLTILARVFSSRSRLTV